MKECLKKKQVRYWGFKKVDSRLLSMGTANDINKKRQELISQKIKHNAALKKLKSDLIHTNRRDSTNKIQEIKDKAAVHIEKRNEINSKLRKIDNFLNKSTVRKKEEKVVEDIMSIKLPKKEDKTKKRKTESKSTAKVDKTKKKTESKSVENEKIMDDIKKIMDKLQSKPDGTIMKRNGLEIKKDNQFEFGIYYMEKGFDNKYFKQNYITSSKSKITEVLFDIETGLIKMEDGVLVDTRQIFERRDYGSPLDLSDKS